MTTANERRKLRSRLDRFVLIQANPFIRQLLRESKGKWANNKEEMREGLLDAITEKRLTLDALNDWLEDVEGWGDQFIYLHSVPEDVSDMDAWRDEKVVEKAVVDTFGAEVWEAESSQIVFPKDLTLKRAWFREMTLNLEWYQKHVVYHEDKSESPKPSEKQLVRTFTQAERRHVVRFQLHRVTPQLWLAAEFIPAQLSQDEARNDHAAARRKIFDDLERLDLIDLTRIQAEQLNMSLVIRHLDRSEMDSDGTGEPEVHTRRAQLWSHGSFVDFSTKAEGHDYWESRTVAAIRKSARPKEASNFRGTAATFEWTLPERSKPALVKLSDHDPPIYIRAQLGYQDVWSILETLKRYERWPPQIRQDHGTPAA